MKVRVTIMTENDKDIPEGYTKEEFEEKARQGWQLIMDLINLNSEDSSEKAVVEKCEVVED